MTPRAEVAAFSRAGGRLAEDLLRFFSGQGWETRGYLPQKYASVDLPLQPLPPLDLFAKRAFELDQALVLVASCGLAVRLIAPYLRGKDVDPAVIVIDETGKYAVSLLSGHIGGANELTQRLADAIGAEAVITTATDRHGLTAVDVWAGKHNAVVENVTAIKTISGAQLDGKPLGWFSPDGVEPPAGFEVMTSGSLGVALTEQLTPPPFICTLWLRPRCLSLGVGCRRGISVDDLRDGLKLFLHEVGYSALSLQAMGSIELKSDEAGLLALAAELDLPIGFYSADSLNALPGQFSRSERVVSITGVDCVCERAAVLSAGGGALVAGKWAKNGMTFALAKSGTDRD